jgi:uncharacterized protein YndB with AHSA1/START domain
VNLRRGIVPPDNTERWSKRLVYTQGAGREDDHAEFHVTVTFETEGAGTRLTLRSRFPSVTDRDRVIREYGALEGAYQTLGRLAEYLAQKA